MRVQISFKETTSLLTKSKLPDADYVINPYLGCPHGCIYCYAEFMKRFSNHNEPWGEFVEVKRPLRQMDLRRITAKDTILIGSVTDAYHPYEAIYGVTRKTLEELAGCVGRVEILTKSKLVCRDIELLKQIPNSAVGISLNTIDDSFRKTIEPFASSVEDRIEALSTLHDAGIATYLFAAPVFPGITDIYAIFKKVSGTIEYACFENLNLRGAYRSRVLSMIQKEYPEKWALYKQIYLEKNNTYWEEVKAEAQKRCDELQLPCKLYFHHGSMQK